MFTMESKRAVLRGLLALMAATVVASIDITIAADLPSLPEGLAAPARPTSMPAFNLATATGGASRAEDLRGKVVVARFWATW